MLLCNKNVETLNGKMYQGVLYLYVYMLHLYPARVPSIDFIPNNKNKQKENKPLEQDVYLSAL